MSRPLLEWHALVRPFPGERVSGDRASVETGDGRVLVVATDGVGHGPQAAAAAERAIAAVHGSVDDDVAAVARRCHAALAGTRGAAVSVAKFDARAQTLSWTGVGNVEGRILRASAGAPGSATTLMLDAGVLGHELPALHPQVVPVSRGDVLVVATDGIEPAFADGLSTAGSCAAIAERILRRHARRTDDALVLVARFLRGAA